MFSYCCISGTALKTTEGGDGENGDCYRYWYCIRIGIVTGIGIGIGIGIVTGLATTLRLVQALLQP